MKCLVIWIVMNYGFLCILTGIICCTCSVTAEKWVPIVEVPVSSMKVFLEKKKQEGFSILGLEQTANSISLDRYMFPKRTVSFIQSTWWSPFPWVKIFVKLSSLVLIIDFGSCGKYHKTIAVACLLFSFNLKGYFVPNINTF